MTKCLRVNPTQPTYFGTFSYMYCYRIYVLSCFLNLYIFLNMNIYSIALPNKCRGVRKQIPLSVKSEWILNLFQSLMEKN